MASILQRWRMAQAPSVINVTVNTGDASTQVLNMKAKELYQTQDNLQAVVNFLANSIAQLPLKVYVRDGEDERRRDRDSAAAQTIWRPNADQTSFEFIRALAIEYFVCGCVYVWILPDADSESSQQLRIVPSEWIQSGTKKMPYAPDTIRICTTNGGTAFDVPREEFVQFRTYSVGSPGGFLSPISALRNTLTEQVEAGRFRRQLWKSSGRLNAQIIRPKDVAPWTNEQRDNFVTMFRQAWGSGGSKAGSIPVMEDGMEIKPFSTSFKESEWSQSVILSREAVAAAYGVNPSLIWHSNTQTYASSKDNARALYAECLGPVIQMLQQRINAFLLPKLGADPNTYVEFDLAEKLKGSFEEQAAIMQTATGRPWMTVDEARAYMNLPKLPDGQGEGLVVPLNVEVGGQANPGNDYDYPGQENQGKKLIPCGCKSCKTTEELRIKGKSDKEDDESVNTVLKSFFKRQKRSVIPKIGADSSDFWDAERWNKELAEDLQPVLQKIADKHGESTADELGSEYVTEKTEGYIKKAAQKRAEKINNDTLTAIEKALASGKKAAKPNKPVVEDEEEEDDEDIVEHVFDVRENATERLALAAAGAIASFAITEATHQAISEGAPRVVGKIVEKEWITGENARASHLAMNGERVPIDADFSNGQHWPGEDIGDPDESCGCNCTTEVVISSK